VSARDQIRKGSTEILLLKLLAEREMYGYEISQELIRRSGGYFETKEGLLYPTLHRMTQDGLLASEWRTSAEGRRRKYYRITRRGRAMLKERAAEWQEFIEQLLGMLGKPRTRPS
jgi:PadR family transcriptional regulator PadR